MAKSKKIAIRIANTFRGSVNPRTQVFEHELDRSGRWIPSNNFRITVGNQDTELPAVLTASAVAKLVSQKPSLQVEADTSYHLVRKQELEPNEKLGLQAGIAWFYRPAQPDIFMSVSA